MVEHAAIIGGIRPRRKSRDMAQRGHGIALRHRSAALGTGSKDGAS